MQNRAKLVAIVLLVGAVLFNLVTLWPQVSLPAPVLNDATLHIPLSARAAEALERGEDPTDPWVSYFVQGYPLFRHYQHLPHVVTALLYEGLGQKVPLRTVYDWITYLLLCTFPLSIYWAGRRVGFSAIPAALAGVIASLLSTNGLYGFDISSYVWRGFGLYTQLWGMWLIGPALAGMYVTVRQGRSYAGTAALVAATVLSHTVLGYVAIISGALIVLLGGWTGVGRRAVRLAGLLFLVLLLASYFIVPFIQDRLYMNRSVWEDPGKYDAYGWQWTLEALVKGGLLDYGHFPSLTILAGLGLVVCLFRWKQEERYRLPVVFFLFWLLLYFGRPTWGALLNLFPLIGDMHLHRLIAPVHLGAIVLATAGLAWLWEQVLAHWPKGVSFSELLSRRPKGVSFSELLSRWQSYLLPAAALLTAALFFPIYSGHLSYLADNNLWMRQNLAAYNEEGGDLDRLFADLRSLPPGRVYAGRGANWGKDYTVGDVSVFALLSQNGFDSPGYLYHALSLNADIEGYLDESRPATMNLFNLRYMLLPEGQSPPSYAQLLATYGRHSLYVISTTGYFDLVDSSFTLYGKRDDWFDAMRTWLQSDLVEKREYPTIALGERPAAAGMTYSLAEFPNALPTLWLPGQEQPACGQIEAEKVAGNLYGVQFRADRACWLLLKETFHPGWEVTLDGQRVEPSMLAPSFTGIPVGSGEHKAEFRYQAGTLRAVLRIVGLVALVAAVVVEWRAGARATPPSPPSTSLRACPDPERSEGEGTGPVNGGEKTLLLTGGAGSEPGKTAPPSATLRAGPVHRGEKTFFALESWLSSSWSLHGRWLALILAVVLVAGLPMLQLKQMSGHDALEYLPRAAEFYRGLSEGQIWPRWAPDLSQGYGQPFFLFNPPVAYYLTALFHFLGASLVASLDLALLLLLALAGLGMYLLGKELFGQAGGVAVGAAYVLAPFTLVNLYVRYAMADYAAMAFIPWALWGLYRWIAPHPERTAKGPKVGALAVAALSIALIFLSSNPVSLFVAPLLAAYVLFLALRARSWPALGRGAWALALGVALPAFFWLPAMLERHWVKVSNLLAGYLNYGNHFVYLQQLFFSRWGYGISEAGLGDGMSFGLGAVHLVLLVAAVLLSRKLVDEEDQRAHLWFFVGVLGVTAFLVTDNSLWLWNALPLLQYLEFPWRILVLGALATAFLCGIPFLLARTPRSRAWLLALVLGALVVFNVPHARPESYHPTTDADYAPAAIAARGIEVTTTGEYEPAWAEQRPEQPAPASRLLLVSGQVRVLEQELSSVRYSWTIEASGPAQLRVATIYYPGWRLWIDGQPARPAVQNPYGMVDLFLTAGTHRVKMEFGTTPTRSVALGVSVVGLGLLALTWVWKSVKREAMRSIAVRRET